MTTTRTRSQKASLVLAAANVIGVLACLAWSLYFRHGLKADYDEAGGTLPLYALFVVSTHWSLWVLGALLIIALLVAKERLRRPWIPLLLNVLTVPAAILYAVVFFLAIINAGFYIAAGTWQDDPRNWYRAFQERQPEGIAVIHSSYWRSAHWTEEHQYFFEVQARPEWTEGFFKSKKAELHPWTRAQNLPEKGFGSPPDWYAPGPPVDYETWISPETGMRIFVNKKNGRVYFDHEIL